MEIVMNDIEWEIELLQPWFHNLHLPDGTQTAPDHKFGDFPKFKWDEIKNTIDENLTGWNVLDMGCNAGYYSFELANRGAQVTAVDFDNHYLNQGRWAVKKFHLENRVQFFNRQIYSYIKSSEMFDLVWYMGVFYHLRYPLMSLDILRKITRKILVFQTMMYPGDSAYSPPDNILLAERELINTPGWPKMAFVEKCIEGDPTNWWVPNVTCVKALLNASGFKIVCEPSHEVFVCETMQNVQDEEYNDILNAISNAFK
jgi:tRNA (mo5U34)-methyltransferase